MFISSYTTIYFFVKNFFPNVQISVNTIFECSCLFFWMKNWPSIKYVDNWGNGGVSSKMCTDAYLGRGVEQSVISYVRTKWMAPDKCCGIFCVHWFGQVHQSMTANKENTVVFFHHNYDYFILCDNQNLVYFFYIRISTKKKKQAFDFLKINSSTNVCLKFLCDAKLITLHLLNMALWWGQISRRRQGRGKGH